MRDAAAHRPAGGLELDLVGVAPTPVFARLESPDDRMSGLVEMRGGVLVRRAVAAADMTTLHAEPKVHPRAAHAQAVLAAVGAGRDLVDLVEMRANVHRIQRTTQRAALAGPLVLVRVAGVPEGNAIANHRGAPKQAGALHGVLAKAVADCIDRRLQALVAWTDVAGEQTHLAGVRFRQSREAHAEGADLPSRLARSEQLECRSIDLLSGRDGIRQRHLLGEVARHWPVDNSDRHHPASTPGRAQPPPDHVRKAHQQLFELALRAGRAGHHVRMAVALPRHPFEVADLEAAQSPQPRFGMLGIPPGAVELLWRRAQELHRRMDAGER